MQYDFVKVSSILLSFVLFVLSYLFFFAEQKSWERFIKWTNRRFVTAILFHDFNYMWKIGEYKKKKRRKFWGIIFSVLTIFFLISAITI